MARYYSKIRKSPSERTLEEEVTVVGNKPTEDEMLPIAGMTAIHVKPRELPNYDFHSSRSTTAEDDQLPIASEKKLDKEIGIPDFKKHMSDKLRGAYNQAVWTRELLDTTNKEQRPAEITRRGWDSRAHVGATYAKNMKTIKDATSQLFTPEKGETRITGAGSHSTLRHNVPVMGAYLNLKYGDLTASGDLSVHSSKLFRSAKEKGFPVRANEYNRRAEVTNDIDFSDEAHAIWPEEIHEYGTEIPSIAVRAANRHLRNTLRGEPKKAMGPQFTQLQLPGVE